MKNFFPVFILLYLVCCCHYQVKSQTSVDKLSIAAHINQNDSLNHCIITTLQKFLSTKDSSWTSNKYWEKQDFTNFIYPYCDIPPKGSSTPTLLEIVDTDSGNRKIVKVAFISHSDSTDENQLACIYNLLANVKNGDIIFSNYLNLSTRNWKTLKKGSIVYKISPYKKINEGEIEQQQKDILRLCRFFEVEPVPAVYYSCRDPEEVFRIRGFDYIPNMYMAKSGGIVYPGNQIFSGTNRDIYTHEVTHIYIGAYFPDTHMLLNEGIATLWGGSGRYDYSWHKQNLKKYILENPSAFRPDQHLDTYDHEYIDNETPLSYMTGALICERTLRLQGKNKLFELFRKKGNLYEILSLTGLNEKNLNEEILREAMLPPLNL